MKHQVISNCNTELRKGLLLDPMLFTLYTADLGEIMVGWGAPRAESTCKWPSEPLVWGHNGRRGNLPDLTIYTQTSFPVESTVPNKS